MFEGMSIKEQLRYQQIRGKERMLEADQSATIRDKLIDYIEKLKEQIQWWETHAGEQHQLGNNSAHNADGEANARRFVIDELKKIVES